jgi:hypothetical protein
MLIAEGLDIGTSLQWWNGPHRETPAGAECVQCFEFGNRQVPTTLHDAEIENVWGSVYLIHLREALDLEYAADRPMLEFVRHASESGALVCYQGGWSREAALDALLGQVDVINVCNNLFHMHRYQPRRGYANLLEVDGFPQYPNTPEGMMRMNAEPYYRMLNWGLRLAAGAGSATGAKQVPAGFNRAYVRCGMDATIQEFHKAWAQGKNFVTNGPMLFLETEEGYKPGDVIDLPSDGGPLTVKLTILADQPITAAELIINGESRSLLDAQDREKRKVSLKTQVRVNRGSWIAARCRVRDDLLSDEELAGFARKRGSLAPCRLRYAHTSPIYVKVGGKGVAVRESIQEGLQMLDAFEEYAREQAAPCYHSMIAKAVSEARRWLERRLSD